MIALGVIVLATGNHHPLRAPFKPNATFHGYACFDDCRGHRNAYDWAAREGIVDPAECRHISRSFSEGCTAWTREAASRALAAKRDRPTP